MTSGGDALTCTMKTARPTRVAALSKASNNRARSTAPSGPSSSNTHGTIHEQCEDSAMFMDLVLSRRLERIEGVIGTSFAEVNERLRPEVGAAWRDFGGTYAIFDGAQSPMTQTFGLGV